MYTETRAVNALMSLTLDRISDGVLLVDANGLIAYVNQPLLDLFGYEEADLLGETVEVLLPEGQRAEHHAHVENFVLSPGKRSMGRDDLDIEGRRVDGTRICVDVKLDVLPGSEMVVATVRDMTAQRQAAVDNAIVRIDLANATTQIDHLQESLDLVIQRLFALGVSITAGASDEPVLRRRLAGATRGIDDVIEAVQQHRHEPAVQ